MAGSRIRPRDVSASDAAEVLGRLNAATTAQELAEMVEIPGNRRVGALFARNILIARDERGGFTSLAQVADVPQVGPGRFTAIVNTLRAGPLSGGSAMTPVAALTVCKLESSTFETMPERVRSRELSLVGLLYMDVPYLTEERTDIPGFASYILFHRADNSSELIETQVSPTDKFVDREVSSITFDDPIGEGFFPESLPSFEFDLTDVKRFAEYRDGAPFLSRYPHAARFYGLSKGFWGGCGACFEAEGPDVAGDPLRARRLSELAQKPLWTAAFVEPTSGESYISVYDATSGTLEFSATSSMPLTAPSLLYGSGSWDMDKMVIKIASKFLLAGVLCKTTVWGLWHFCFYFVLAAFVLAVVEALVWMAKTAGVYLTKSAARIQNLLAMMKAAESAGNTPLAKRLAKRANAEAARAASRIDLDSKLPRALKNRLISQQRHAAEELKEALE